VKVTGVFAQILLAEGDIETLAGSNGFTVIVTGSELAGLPETQDAFDVKTQVTASAFDGA